MDINTDSTSYKETQRNNRQRMCQQYTGPSKEEKKVVVDSESGRIYTWDHNGIKKAGVRIGNQDFSILREPANKKERRKMLAGEAYRDKKGKVEKDARPEMS